MSVCVTCVAIQMQSRYVLTELPLFPILVAIRYVHLSNTLIVLKLSCHEMTFEGFVTALKYSCDSTINRKMSSYEDLTSSDVLILILGVKLSLINKSYLVVHLNKVEEVP